MMRCVAACLVQRQAVAGPVGLNSAKVVIFPHKSYLCLHTLMSKASAMIHDLFSATPSCEILSSTVLHCIDAQMQIA